MPPRSKKYTLGSTGEGPSEGPEELTVPSGETCLVRRPGLQQLLIEGVLHDTDILTSIVQENIDQAERGRPIKQVSYAEIVADKDKFTSLLHTVDRMVCAVVVKPRVLMPPNDVTLRRAPGPDEEPFVYADMIDLEDRMFIVNYALGGTRDLASFREGSSQGVGAVRSRQTASRTSQPARSRQR